METPPPPPNDLPTKIHQQLVQTLTHLLPPPLDTTPEALQARNQAAIAKVAAMFPVNANELDLAAQCIAARAQAEDILRLIRQHAGDMALTMRLNAQYTSMVRTSLSVHGHLMRVQAARHKREATKGAADQDAWTLHIAEQSMQQATDTQAKPTQPDQPTPKAATANQKTENKTISHNMAFETRMSDRPSNRGFLEPTKADLRAAVRQAMSEARSRAQKTQAKAPG